MIVKLDDREVIIKNTIVVEYADDEVKEDLFKLDGTEVHSKFWNSPRVQTANIVESGDTLIINSKVIFYQGGQTSEMISKEKWSLSEDGSELIIQLSSSSFWGNRQIATVFARE
jgi:hypothetical protein